MPATPSGNLSTAVDTFRTLISVGTAFQAWTSSANATAALARIYAWGTKSRTRPCCMFRPTTGRYRELEGWSGTFETWFEADTGAAYQVGGNEATDLASGFYEFTNSVGPIIEEICANQQAAGYTFISREVGVAFKDMIARSDAQAGDYHQWVVDFPWGLQ